MKRPLFSIFAIVGLAMATTLSLSILTACSTAAGDAIDLGLSVKWATVNIGATLPADYGNYYAWGETETKDEYTLDNSVTYGDSSIEDFAGNATYDAAKKKWGGTWRMPTEAECQELVDDCTWTWTTQENFDSEKIDGFLVEGSNGNSIFLPAAGFYNGSLLHDGAAVNGYYWSSTPDTSSSYNSYNLYFYISSGGHKVTRLGRPFGAVVRPVAK